MHVALKTSSTVHSAKMTDSVSPLVNVHTPPHPISAQPRHITMSAAVLTTLHVLSIASAIAAVLAPSPGFWRIYKTRSTGSVSVLPAILIFCNCYAWVCYARVVNSVPHYLWRMRSVCWPRSPSLVSTTTGRRTMLRSTSSTASRSKYSPHKRCTIASAPAGPRVSPVMQWRTPSES